MFYHARQADLDSRADLQLAAAFAVASV
jgi:hypothetical protein